LETKVLGGEGKCPNSLSTLANLVEEVMNSTWMNPLFPLKKLGKLDEISILGSCKFPSP
jgi:hypothetical protein